MEAELQDWELLDNNTDDDDYDYDYDVVRAPAADEFPRECDEESESVIRSGYFANTKEEVDDQGSVQSDWLDPSSHTFETTNESGGAEFWSDSASVAERFEQWKHDLGFADEIPVDFGSDSGRRIEAGFQENPERTTDLGGESEIRVGFGSVEGGAENDLGASAGGEGRRGELGSAEEIGTEKPEEIGSLVVNSGGGDKRGGTVCWKLPLELLKFFVFRVSPVWSVSIAAAVVGLVILKRRLYKMKNQTRRIALNVTLEVEDNKKVSQFIARAAHLNEAFSVVKHVPMIRPSLPAAGLTPWPVMSLR